MLNLLRQKNIVFTGHYGSGKTTLSINLALELKKRGEEVTLADLDIVNPYFCSAEYTGLLEAQGIEVIASRYAGSNLDAPALTGRVDAAIASNRRLVIDAGGDDAGAAVLGRYSRALAEAGYEMLYTVNACRLLTRTPDEAADLLRQIEGAARLRAAGIVSNTNLGDETTLQTVRDGAAFAEKVCRLTGLPLYFTAAAAGLPGLKELEGTVFPVKTVVRKPWDPEL